MRQVIIITGVVLAVGVVAYIAEVGGGESLWGVLIPALLVGGILGFVFRKSACGLCAPRKPEGSGEGEDDSGSKDTDI